MEAGRVLLLLVLLLVSAQSSECVRCFARFDLSSGLCDKELGEVDEDDCCQNLKYGYQEADGECHSCGLSTWSPWSSWSECSVLCGEGVRQKRRKCFGIGECKNAADNLQTEPCLGTCCDEKGWGSWLDWSPCSVTCEGDGVRRRERACNSSPQCRSSCRGPSEQTETCEAHNRCPVHGGWSGWSDWSDCSGTCIDSKKSVPLRERERVCRSPAPSNNTVPPGDNCPGEERQGEMCSELPNCPEDGVWGVWSSPGPCSVTCGEGIQLSIRSCDSPPPKYGGQFCEGTSSRTNICRSPCPVDGFWSGWSQWSKCSVSCIPEGRMPVRLRHRSCTNPAPSSNPLGQICPGDNMQEEACVHLSHCPVDGTWGSWSSFSDCPVTCGVGLRLSVRRCDSPAPNHGGLSCPGEERRTVVCSTNIHCPVDGIWSEWTEWQLCTPPWKQVIRCRPSRAGSQTRERTCLHQAHNGSICRGVGLSQSRLCHDITGCELKGSWKGWGTWSFCQPACGENSNRVRERICEPDYSSYLGVQQQKGDFFGNPDVDCGSPPDGEPTYQLEPCMNVPPCA